MKGLLLAGGHGTRLRPLTFTGNKHMLPVANKPMLFYGLEDLRNAGVTDIGIIFGPIKEGIAEAIGDGSKFLVKVTYIEQPKPMGIAHAIGLAQNFICDEPFVVYLGDNILKNGINKFVEAFKESDCDAAILLSEVKDPQRFGVAEMNGDKVIRLVEKPKVPPSNLALVGVYLFRPVIFESIKKLKPSWRHELEITEAIQNLIDWNCKVKAFKVQGWWKDAGKPEDLLEANQLVLSDLEPFNKGTIDSNVAIYGKVGIDEETVILNGSCIRGPSIIGRRCKIGPNAYIGPYTSIGDGVSIIGGEIENTIILSDTIIECEKRIVDSLIGRNSKIVSAEKNLPKGCRLIVGENTLISI